ncbi:hypothetical protein NQ317_004245 [Molorchus minor]|uniref:Tf2-1-like SH3-like domain-containing protein n=1 Tax=Molorchus minor TaxID=1323400 RepID=A0ABQ9K0F3_9CUCU|nr:hypothetical protein NQ317_004245 [Molorchus minor]
MEFGDTTDGWYRKMIRNINEKPEYIGDGNEYAYLLRDPAEEINIDSEVRKRTLPKQELLPRRKGIGKFITYEDDPYILKSEIGCGERIKLYRMRQKNINAKLSPKYVGPFTVHRKIGNWTYDLLNTQGKSIGIWDVQDLKPTWEPDND